MEKKLFVVFVFFYITTSFAQSQLDGYKYVIVPKKFEFLKENDKFELNSLTKFLFKKAGFETIIKGDDSPEELAKNPCLGVLVDLKDNSSMFTTKVTLDLTDCHNKIIYTSDQGSSKEKDYKKTYQQALRKAFASIEAMNYKFNPDLVETSEKKQNTVVAQNTKSNSVEVKQEEPKAAAVVAAPIVVTEVAKDTEVKKEEVEDATAIARSFKNKNISFFLINQNNNLVAYVIESKIESYKKGESIGTFVKTSLPNVYKVSWKNKQKGIDETIAYFDENGNLKVEINRNGKIEILEFEAEK